jgi:hypothetical protein
MRLSRYDLETALVPFSVPVRAALCSRAAISGIPGFKGDSLLQRDPERIGYRRRRCARDSLSQIFVYRGIAKWAALTGSCSSRRSIWTASATQLLAMPRIIVSDRIVTLVRDSRVHSAACRLHS